MAGPDALLLEITQFHHILGKRKELSEVYVSAWDEFHANPECTVRAEAWRLDENILARRTALSSQGVKSWLMSSRHFQGYSAKSLILVSIDYPRQGRWVQTVCALLGCRRAISLSTYTRCFSPRRSYHLATQQQGAPLQQRRSHDLCELIN